jgi:hypothetical protein
MAQIFLLIKFHSFFFKIFLSIDQPSNTIVLKNLCSIYSYHYFLVIRQREDLFMVEKYKFHSIIDLFVFIIIFYYIVIKQHL